MHEILFAFSYIRKRTYSFAISLCVSAWNISVTSGQNFMYLWIWLFWKSVEEVCVALFLLITWVRINFVDWIENGILSAIVYSRNVFFYSNVGKRSTARHCIGGNTMGRMRFKISMTYARITYL